MFSPPLPPRLAFGTFDFGCTGQICGPESMTIVTNHQGKVMPAPPPLTGWMTPAPPCSKQYPTSFWVVLVMFCFGQPLEFLKAFSQELDDTSRREGCAAQVV